MSMIQKLDDLHKEFQGQIAGLTNQADVLNLKADYLGKKGKVSEILKSLKDASAEERKELGPKANTIKDSMQEMVQDKLTSIELEEINQKLAQDKIDITYTNSVKETGIHHGGVHPRTLIQQEIEDIFLSMGFDILDGPHIEDEFHNFEALNIPGDHPARDMQDTFWFDDPESPEGRKHLLRTHTSTIQVRGMMSRKPPFRFIAPGTVFRCERTDASHEMVFNQLEGMMVGENVSVANLIYFMKTILTEIFKKEVEVRLRPGFFPFVEPGFELDIKCLICSGKGCSVCKHTGWVELLPCGMVHPNVLKAGGIDTEKYNGFAFGLGMDRLVMMKYGIEDIRHLQSGDLRFNSQFKTF
ncbi:MAG: phenylalanine--tRNA ligase subunit alpha [Deltaproteobacteria bacterium]|nr:MAG: phenylalanine--tRNA ligase subunit alpha [Deltaproteobacteria bacterium]